MSLMAYSLPKPGSLTVVLAHDYLSQQGGAERVTLELAAILKPSYILTSVYDPGNTFSEFRFANVKSTILNHVPLFRRDPRAALPFLAAAWNSIPAVKADIVFCSSSGWAHGVRVADTTRKIVYCHNPPRWLYQTDDYIIGKNLFERTALHFLRPILLAWDRKAAASADLYIANSTSVANRIKEAYGRECKVVFPAVSVDVDGIQEAVPGVTLPFFLTVGRSRGYKGTRSLVDAFSGLPEHRLVAVGSTPDRYDPVNYSALGRVTEPQLRWLYSKATALISVSREDFGLTPIEANAFGTPALVLRAGGFLDSTDEGISGLFIDSISVDDIRRAVRAFPVNWDSAGIVLNAARFSKEVFRQNIMKAVNEVSTVR